MRTTLKFTTALLLLLVAGVVLSRFLATEEPRLGTAGESADPAVESTRNVGLETSPKANDVVTITQGGDRSGLAATTMVEVRLEFDGPRLAGEVEIEFLGFEALQPPRRIAFKDRRFRLALAPSHRAILVKALVLEGERLPVLTEDSWYTREQLIEKKQPIRLEIGRPRRVVVRDAATRASIDDAEVYATKPDFIQNARRETRSPELLASGSSLLYWRDPPRHSGTVYVSAPGYAAVALQPHENEVALEPSGRLWVLVDDPQPESLAQLGGLNLHVTPLGPGTKSWGRHEPASGWSRTLLDSTDADLVFGRLPPGQYRVSLWLKDMGHLVTKPVTVVRDNTAIVRFDQPIEALQRATAQAHFQVYVPGEFDLSTSLPRNFSLTPLRGSETSKMSTPPPYLRRQRWNADLRVTELDFGRVASGDYELRVLSQRVEVQLAPGQEGPIPIYMKMPRTHQLKVVDAQGEIVSAADLELEARPWGRIPAEGDEGSFRVPYGCSVLTLHYRDRHDLDPVLLSIPVAEFYRLPLYQYFIPELTSFDIHWIRPTENDGQPSQITLSPYPILIQDAQGESVPILRLVKEGDLETYTVAARGPVTVSSPTLYDDSEARRRTIELAQDRHPRIEFKLEGIKLLDDDAREPFLDDENRNRR